MCRDRWMSRCGQASARLKNDKVDAAILAQLLRADLLPEAWIAPPKVRQLRALLRHAAPRLLTLMFHGLRDGQIRCKPAAPAPWAAHGAAFRRGLGPRR